MRVVMISGKAGSGKDTTAKLMKEKLEARGYRVLITHFADPVKFVCQNFFGWDGNKDKFGRSLLQYVGTEGVRSKYEDFWVEFVMKVLSCFPNQYDYVLIPDARFPNEIQRTIDFFPGSVHIRIERPSYISALSEEQLAHSSETALDYVEPDTFIHNSGSIEDLSDVIDGWLDEYIGYYQLTFEEFMEKVKY